MSSAADASAALAVSRASVPSDEPRVPVWAWVVIGLLAAALLAVSIGLLFKLEDNADKARAAANSNLELMNGLVASVAVTNQQVAALNKQLESISTSAKSAASSAQGKASSKKQSKGGG